MLYRGIAEVIITDRTLIDLPSGFVGADGQLAIQGPSEQDLEDFPKLYASYERVVVSRETTESAKRPSRIILSGRLPQGR